MGEYKTERATVLHQSNLSIEKKVCLAVADFKMAIKNSNFAAEHGGIDAIQHDLFLFTEQWADTL